MRVRSPRGRMAAIVITVAAPAGAQPAPAAPTGSANPNATTAPALVPLVLISSPDVAYPDGAHGDVVVRLVVTVARDGSVESVRVVEGDEPFGSAAESAARTWRFTPATRGEAPVAARIRLEVAF